jgi:small subunit ribosomal protein S2
VTTVSLIDTDCDPDMVDLPIPGNDDGIRSIEIIIRQLADSIAAAKGMAIGQAKAQEPEAGELAMAGAGKEGEL